MFAVSCPPFALMIFWEPSTQDKHYHRLPDELTLLSAEVQTLRQNPTLGTADPRCHTNTIRSTSLALSPNTAGLTARLRFCLYIWSGLWRTAGPAGAQSAPVQAYIMSCLDFISHVSQIAQSTAITERESEWLFYKCSVLYGCAKL